MTKTEMTKKLEARKDRSAWDKAVTIYALELLEDVEKEEIAETGKELEKLLLNGADTWDDYSWGGGSLIYNYEIAERTCTPSELKKTRGGERRPNGREEWLDVQARALYQASNRIRRIAR